VGTLKIQNAVYPVPVSTMFPSIDDPPVNCNDGRLPIEFCISGIVVADPPKYVVGVPLFPFPLLSFH